MMKPQRSSQSTPLFRRIKNTKFWDNKMDFADFSGQNKSNSAGTREQNYRLSHVLAILFSVSLIVSVSNKSLFSYHPTFMTLGYVVFMAEGVIAGIKFRRLDGKDRAKAITTHAMWQLSAVSSILIAFTLIYYNKMLMGKPHFTSWHAKFGLATVIFSVITPILGATAFRTLGLLQKFEEKTQVFLKKAHRNMGAIVWMVSLFTIELALPHKAVFKGWLTHVWQVVIVALGVSVLIQLFKKSPKKTDDGCEIKMQEAVFKGWLTHVWQVVIVALGVSVLIQLFKKSPKKTDDGELIMKAV
eukprot:TRINITY_DN3425_c0_g1_i2.p1 TRINITY_DN3425_c0_g1~~TRINITY_DN3425_c0_g1_i2.p1  ORF type:complete len:300 (-),score=38.26 TRINITY_DN3425_c0_g1_i2:403-1302(-)